MAIHMDIEKDKIGKVALQLNAMAAKAYSSVDSRSETYHDRIAIKKSEIAASGVLDSYRAQTVQLNHQKQLERKSELIIR